MALVASSTNDEVYMLQNNQKKSFYFIVIMLQHEYYITFIKITEMKICLVLFLACLSTEGYAQTKKFGYELRIFPKQANANGNFYPGDEFSIKIVPLNVELWDKKSRFYSLLDYATYDNQVNILLPQSTHNATDYMLRNDTITIEGVVIDETTQKGLESLTLLVTEEPIDLSTSSTSLRSSTESAKMSRQIKDELLLLMKGSPLSQILAKQKNDGSLIISTVSFNVWPKEEKGFKALDEKQQPKAAYVFVKKDSTEFFESPIKKEIFSRNDFPSIAFIDPGSTVKQISDSLSKLSLNKIVLKGMAFDEEHGIKQISINGQKPNSYNNGNGLFEFKYTLQNGINEIFVTAENNIGNKKSYRLKFNYETPTKRKNYLPKNYLLVIGINNYSQWPPLKNAKTDADSFKALMLSKYGFKKENVIDVFNNEATYSRLTAQLDYLIEVIHPEDNLLIYYAGHGMYEKKPPMGYWVTVEAKINEKTTYFPNVMLGNLIRQIKAKSIFIISDACYSGALYDEAALYLKSVNSTDKTRLILTSGGYETVPDKSIFAEKIIAKLSSPNTKEISAKELIAFIKNEFKNSSQKPTGGVLIDSFDEDGDFVLTKQ